ncbi:MAG TPA: ECF transporter S component [Clostridia bacterium]|nr:ECF transporter S component [Clostridia bacterium]
MKTNEIVLGGLLTALALVIPMAFGGILSIVIPPFSATLAAHVPIMLSMTISPLTAIMVGLGSSLGFLIKLGPIIAARALVHVVFGFVGALLYKKGKPFYQILLITLPIHGIGEALIVLPFGLSLYDAGLVVGIGTMLHHAIDSVISLGVLKQLTLVKKSFTSP